MIILRASAIQLGSSSDYINEIVDQELSGQGALKQIMSGKQYSLIFTDLSMPIQNGYQLAK